MLHDGMSRDLIQGLGQGHESFKLENFSIFKTCPPPLVMGAGIVPDFCSDS